MINKYNKGYTLLFAIIVATLVLSIGSFILSVSRKQLLLSTSARDSVLAFYAADSGIQCAILRQDWLTDLSTNENDQINCSSSNALIINNGTYKSFAMFFENEQDPDNQSCARVVVSQSEDLATGNVTTTIESRGYNVGRSKTADQNCDTPSPNKVERAIRVTYSQ